MPQFLTTSGTSHYIEDIIIKAKTELVLITPYLKLSRILSERLTEASQRGVNIKLVYGKSELKPSERKQVESLSNIELLYLENLHAKCYHNDATLIVSSMNLYEFSERNNREMGIVLTRSDDGECFMDALTEAQSIITAARAGSTSTLKHAAISTGTSIFSPPPLVHPSKEREFDYALQAHKVHELLKQQGPTQVQFNIKKKPHAIDNGFTTVVYAQNYPRHGIHFEFNGKTRFDFETSLEYNMVKASKCALISKLLTDYRCYWNHNVVQIYGAKGYNPTDEQAAAEHHVRAIMQAANSL